jgi:flagellar biosynthesis activator protein FlaF
MSFPDPARSGYAAAHSVRTDRGTEYAIFARITHRLSTVDETNRSAYPALARAVSDNSRLWGALSDDLLHDGNMLPVELRAQLVSIAEFVRRHSHAVLAGRETVRPLIDINTSVMRGLRGGVEAAA